MIKMTAEETCQALLRSIAEECDPGMLARADGYLFRYVRDQTALAKAAIAYVEAERLLAALESVRAPDHELLHAADVRDATWDALERLVPMQEPR